MIQESSPVERSRRQMPSALQKQPAGLQTDVNPPLCYYLLLCPLLDRSYHPKRLDFSRWR
jgi:hypothetical protein